MNKRVLIILLIAFVIATLSSYIVYRIVNRHLTTPQRMARVVVAAKDVKVGTVLRDDDLKLAGFVGAVPKGAILTPPEAIGRGIISNIYEGEIIMSARLAPSGSGGGLAATIKPGMRACAVKVDEVVGVAGFVTPGMRVDVLISGNPPALVDVNQGQNVKTILQNIEVLSAGTDIQKDAEGKPKPVQVVTLMVTPEQAEILSLASYQTHIQLILRNPLDTKLAHPPGTTVVNLFADANGEVPKLKARTRTATAPASRIHLVEIYNGSKRTEEKFVTREGKQ